MALDQIGFSKQFWSIFGVEFEEILNDSVGPFKDVVLYYVIAFGVIFYSAATPMAHLFTASSIPHR
jgi:hypothetical protein